ncbi:hypothetical protein RST01_02140 [Rummeliibacillus stabekisii]|nr:hypothetical protein RST01_02140 [Rummeliibacillus stabekisii]
MLGSITYLFHIKILYSSFIIYIRRSKKEILNIALALIELDRSYTIPTGSIRKSSFFLEDDENVMIEIITTVSNLHDFLSR